MSAPVKATAPVTVEPLFLNIPQLAQLMNISEGTCELSIKVVPPEGLFRVGRLRLISRDDAVAYAHRIQRRGGVSTQEIKEAEMTASASVEGGAI
jgi:hypothetical protein